MPQLNLLLCATTFLAIIAVGTSVTSRSLTIAVKYTRYDLYIDGVRQNNTNCANNWTIPDVISISALSRLIGVMAIDTTETCAGIIGSVTDDYLVTDGINWKCSYIGLPEPSWYLLGWDDSHWPLSYSIGTNGNVTSPPVCEILTEIPSISRSASWIWTDTIPETPAYHQFIYCRGYIPLCERDSPCRNGGTCNKNNETLCSCLHGFIGEFCESVDTKDVTITVKSELYAAYVDGVESVLQNGDNWQLTDTLRVSSISRLLAVMAIQLESTCPGILAFVNDSRGDYMLTNTAWKCSASATVGWAEFGYDDSTWPNAVLMHQNAIVNDTQCWNQFVQIPAISSNAYWIWTSTSVSLDVGVYCRGYLPICDVHPCKNGGTCNSNAPKLCTCLPNFTGKYCEQKISDDAALSSEDGARTQKSGASGDIAPIPPPNPVQSPNPVPHPAPYPAPIQTSDETGNRNERMTTRKHHNG